VLVRVWGRGAASLFRDEAGGHRYQRVPPTEKRGRVHTSTITVAVLPEPAAGDDPIDPRDIEESFTRGAGKGGQHLQKNDTAVILVHRPTGLRVRLDGGRSQWRNRQNALALLRHKLDALRHAEAERTVNAARRGQVGSGMRGDKIRTIAFQRGTVTDHRTGRTVRLHDWLHGRIRALRGADSR
jgi:peptide chain release factor 1